MKETNLSLNHKSLSLPLPSFCHSSILFLFLHPCSLAFTSSRNVFVVPLPPISGVFALSGASARAPSTALESLSEKSGKFRCRSIMLAVSRADVGFATPRPAMSAATGFFMMKERERGSFEERRVRALG